MKKVRTIRIDKEVSDKLDSICERHGDISWHIENALNAYPPIKKLGGKPKEIVSRFSHPTTQEAGNYFLERGSTDAINEGDKFVDFYSSKNWMVGKNKMKDWKAAIRNWMRKSNEDHQQANQPNAKQRIGAALHGSTANDW